MIRAFLVFVSIIVILSFSHAALEYRPKSKARVDRLLVVLHGCMQTAKVMAEGTGFNVLAEKNGFAVLYPQIPDGSNKDGCWNWFDPANQVPGSGQLKQVVDEIGKFKKENGNPNLKVFVAGISSGAATTMALLSCYPELFEAGAMVAGPPYGRANDVLGAFHLMTKGEPQDGNTMPKCQASAYKNRVFILQGMNDVVVHPKAAALVASDFAGGDPKEIFETVKRKPVEKFGERVLELAKGRVTLMLVDGMPHAWPGTPREILKKGPEKVPYFTSIGPSATELIVGTFGLSLSKNTGD